MLSLRDSSALAQLFPVAHYQVTGCATHGGYDEQTVAFQGSIALAGPE